MFRLQKLEITGFKSFADYTEIVFTGDGITAIVGPNGCGKSNCAEAMTWVLGEQRAKTLRSSEMQDVIFQGAKSRHPSGMAEVILTLMRTEQIAPSSEVNDLDAALCQIDNQLGGGQTATEEQATGTRYHPQSKHWRPSGLALSFQPGAAVTVTRRLYRSGESDYLMNGRACRLRDIQDLFAGTGLSGAHYAIIEQGRIGQILSGKPTDRRALIEEAAGVSKFRVRQRAAETRLQAARANLSRIDDIISEVERQVQSLRRQAAKTRRYRVIREDLRAAVRRLLCAEAHELDALLTVTETQLTAATQTETALTAQVTAHEAQARQATQAARDAEENLSRLRADAAQAALQRDRRAREHEYQAKQSAEITQRRGAITLETATLATRQDRAAREIEQASAHEASLRAENDTAAARLQSAETVYQKRRQTVTDAEVRVEKARAELLRRTAFAERLAGVSRQLEHTLERLAQQAEGLQRESARAAAVHAEHAAAQTTLQDDIRHTHNSLTALRAQRDTALQAVHTAREDVRATGAERAKTREEASRVKHRLDSLLDLERKRAHYAPVVQRLLAEAAKSKRFQAFGTLAEALQVSAEWEKAVEGAFGAALQTVLVPTQADAAQAARWLQQQKAGRAAFLVSGISNLVSEISNLESDISETQIPDTRYQIPDTRRQMPDAKFQISKNKDYALAILETTNGHGPRLGDILGLTTDLRQALEQAWPQLLKAHLVNDLDAAFGHGGDCVTRAGDCVLGGLVHAGEARGVNESAGLLAFNRELRELKECAIVLEKAVAIAATAANAARNKLQTAETQLNTANDAIARAEREIMAQDMKAKQLAQELERAARHQKVVADDLARLAREQQELQTKRAQSLTDADRAAQARDEAQDQVSAANLSLTTARRAAESENQTLNTLRTAAATAAERRRNAANELRRWQNEHQDLAARLQRCHNENDALAQRLDALQVSLAQLETAIAQADAEKAAEAAALNQANAHLNTTRQRADTLAVELSALNQQATVARDSRAALEVQHAAASERLNHVNENCLVELNLSLQDLAQQSQAEKGFDLVAGRARVEELRAKVESFGPVNLMALEELNEAEARFTFLTTQRQDITDGLAATDEALTEIKRRSRERFRQAFAEINRHFGVLFQELFGGGRGEMSLIDDRDVLESGIDLIAQPPGKRLQNVLLLSGGEKAMAALALVLAIFRYRPSPFCLLDEVDAPLDEANVGRFVEKIRQMSEETQFLVITHNKRTMEAARALYGVTMQEAGVSKLVSVRFE